MTALVIRKAVLADIPAIVSLAVESVSRDPLPVKVDEDAMRAMCVSLIGHPSHFVWVSEVDGAVVACVGAQVSKGFWFRGCQASVLLFFTRHAGACVPLLRRYADWVKTRPVIKIAVFELEPTADPRLARVLYRFGFQRQSMNCAYIRGKS
jgi:hypothetical protein